MDITEHQNFDTFCPCFPGFYESFLYNSDMDVMAENELITEHPADFPAELLRYYFRNKRYSKATEMSFDFDKYMKDIAINFLAAVASHLEDILPDFKVVKFDSIVSPREYNFRTDSVHCAVKFAPGDAIAYCREHLEEFKEYLIANYKSRDGFISFYSYDEKDWLDPENWGGHEPGAILDFILRNNLGSDTEYILSTEAMEDVYFADYWTFPEAVADFIDSPQGKAIAQEYRRMLRQGDLYIDAMGGTARAKKLVEEAKPALFSRLFKSMQTQIQLTI